MKTANCNVVFLIYLFISLSELMSLSNNAKDMIASAYSKVAHWGSAIRNGDEDEARSSSGQKLWTHRSDVSIKKHENIKFLQPKFNNNQNKPSLRIGEIQERFNPRPYFDFVTGSYRPTRLPVVSKLKPNDKPSVVYGVPANPSSIKSGFNGETYPINLYSSPYNSYNPPEINQSSMNTLASGSRKKPPSTSYGVPEEPTKGVEDEESNTPAIEEGEVHSDPISSSVEAHAPYLGYGQYTLDPQFVPTQNPGSKDYGKLPEYLNHGLGEYDDEYQYKPHFDHHHIYHEKPMTTTKKPEHQRVHSGNYSYYYLGRKLWYIPLYFSIYFIVYITILILKSIARHKIQFSHNFEKSRSLRQFDMDNIFETVSEGITGTEKKYFM